MKRAARSFLAAAVLFGAGVWIARPRSIPVRDTLIGANCRAPARVLWRKPAAGDVVVFHGLAANARIMQSLGEFLAQNDLRVFLVDLPGHGNNTQPFSFERASACATEVVETLERQGEIELDKTVLLGHSMGGGIAIGLADRFPTVATIALSPAPMMETSSVGRHFIFFRLPRRVPANLLVFTGQLEPPGLRRAARELIRWAGGERYSEPGDFTARRAAQLVEVPLDTHLGVVFDCQVRNLISNHWLEPLGIGTRSQACTYDSVLWGTGVGTIGLALAFPAVVAGVARVFRATRAEASGLQRGAMGTLLWWATAGLSVTGLLKLGVPLPMLNMYNADYLASFVLVAGLTLSLALGTRRWRQAVPLPQSPSEQGVMWRPVAAAVFLGIATILVLGAWFNWRFSDAWMNAERWWRFVLLLVACVPYMVAEEWALGPVQARGALGNVAYALRRWGLFLAMRLVLWLAVLVGLFVLDSGQILLLLLAMYMGILAIFQRLGSDAVRKRTGSPGAAAVFGAILTAWFIAAVFPLT